MKFAFIKAQKAQFPVEMMCHHLGVSRSGYYAFCHRRPSLRRQQDQLLQAKIQAIHQRSRGTYGRPRVQAALRSQGIKTSAKRVQRLMKHQGLYGRRPRRYRSTTDSGHAFPVAPNVLARAFWAQALNQAWVGDITFIHTSQGWLYLAVLLDLFSRRVIGWSRRRLAVLGARYRGTDPCPTARLLFSSHVFFDMAVAWPVVSLRRVVPFLRSQIRDGSRPLRARSCVDPSRSPLFRRRLDPPARVLPTHSEWQMVIWSP